MSSVGNLSAGALVSLAARHYRAHNVMPAWFAGEMYLRPRWRSLLRSVQRDARQMWGYTGNRVWLSHIAVCTAALTHGR